MADQHQLPRNRTTPSHDDVARRAYELFQARGGEPGRDVEHWLDAERELSHPLAGEGPEQAQSRQREGES